MLSEKECGKKTKNGTVILGEVNDTADFDIWDEYDAAHTFLPHYKDLWQGFG